MIRLQLNLVADLDQFHAAILGPPKMNARAAAAFTKGYYAMLKDPAFQNEAKKIVGSGYEPRSKEFAVMYFKQIASLDPAMVAYSKAYLAKGAKGMKKKRRK